MNGLSLTVLLLLLFTLLTWIIINNRYSYFSFFFLFFIVPFQREYMPASSSLTFCLLSESSVVIIVCISLRGCHSPVNIHFFLSHSNSNLLTFSINTMILIGPIHFPLSLIFNPLFISIARHTIQTFSLHFSLLFFDSNSLRCQMTLTLPHTNPLLSASTV